MPNIKTENLLPTVCIVAPMLDVAEFTEIDVEALRKLLSKAWMVPGAIVRFGTHEARKRWWEQMLVVKRI